MKISNAILGGILLVLDFNMAENPDDKGLYRTETTVLGPVELARDQEVKINSSEPIQVDIGPNPIQIEAPNPIPVEVRR